MFAMTSGTTNRPKTIPVTARVAPRLSRRLDDLGHPGVRRPPRDPPRRPPADPPARQRLARVGHARGHPLRRDHRSDRPHAEPAGPHHLLHAGGRRADQGHRVEVLRRAAALGLSRPGDDHRRQPEHDPGHRPAGRPREGAPDPRPRRRHDRRKWEIPAEVRAALRRGSAPDAKARARRLEAIVERTGRLLPKDYWPNLDFLANWTGGTMGAYLRGYPEFFGERPVRDVGLIASEGRMTIPIEDGTPAGILDIRHHYFEFIPEDQADREEPETVEATELIEGRQLLHPADDRRRPLPLPDLRPGPLRRLPRQGPADRVPEQGGPLLQPDGREALRVPGGRRRRRGPATARHCASARSCSCRPGASRRITRCWSRRPTSTERAAADRLAAEVEPSCSRQNVEYENKRATLPTRPGPHRRIPPARGPISSSGGWRRAAEPSNNISSRTSCPTSRRSNRSHSADNGAAQRAASG